MFTNILTLNFYELFEIPVSYSVDLRDLKTRYTDLQQAVHPDKFANAGSQEKRLSMQQTSHINEAFQTLKDPVARAIYLLRLKGMDVDMDNETTMDMAFLMEQMEMREAMADIRDNDDPLDRLDAMTADVKQHMASMTQTFSEKYEQDELEDSKEIIRKLQFLHKAKKELADLSAQLEDELI